MSKNEISSEIWTAYRKLKRMVYYDNGLLFLRDKLATYEASDDFESRLKEFGTVVGHPEPHTTQQFQRWLGSIEPRLVPKKVWCKGGDDSNEQSRTEKSPVVITNVSSSDEYEMDFNCHFDGSIELYLLAVVWIMREGYRLDRLLSPNCYGSRLDPVVGEDGDHSARLFRKYHEYYAQWRDNAIREAERLLVGESKDVCILGLDIRRFYYCVDIDFAEVRSSIGDNAVLLPAIKSICEEYRSKISAHLTLIDDRCPKATGLPIGYPASPILANWHLLKFDDSVRHNVMPVYYGRYIDDMLIVIGGQVKCANTGVDSGVDSGVHELIDRVLVKAGIVTKDDSVRADHSRVNVEYKLNNYAHLSFQYEKLVIQYFSPKFSPAGLRKFKKQLDDRRSDFRLWPVEAMDVSLEDVAYDLLLAGPGTKFRSFRGVVENRYELATQLAKQIMLLLCVDVEGDGGMSQSVLDFFNGKSALQYYDLWEKVYAYFAVAGDDESSDHFTSIVLDAVGRLRYSCKTVETIVADTLEQHQVLCREMARAICRSAGDQADSHFRLANLVRHQYVHVPLLNYTSYKGSYLDRQCDVPNMLESARLKRSPRYISLDEFAQFYQRMPGSDDALTKALAGYKEQHSHDVDSVRIDECGSGSSKYLHIRVGSATTSKDGLRVALANYPVLQENVEGSFLNAPKVGRSRFVTMASLLNGILQYEKEKKSKVDLLVFPEVSIPHYWEPTLVAWSRKNQVAIVCGLEHRVSGSDVCGGGVAHNEVLVALPYKTSAGYNACLPVKILKKYYSPKEQLSLTGHHLQVPQSTNRKAFLFQWNGWYFSVYNCYEIASIQDRGQFVGKVDFLVCTEFNRDVEYFSNIVESAARDIHCYVVQVNDSEYGDSRIVSPSSRDTRDPLWIKGGDNVTFLVDEIEIAELRKFQRVEYHLQKDSRKFKPTPPGWRHCNVVARQNGQLFTEESTDN